MDWKIINDNKSWNEFHNMSLEEKRHHLFIHCRTLPILEKARVSVNNNGNTVIQYCKTQYMFKRNTFFTICKFQNLATITSSRVFCQDLVFAGEILKEYYNLKFIYPVLTKTLLRQIVKKGQIACDEYSHKKKLESNLPDSLDEMKYFIEGDIDKDRFINNSELFDLYRQAKALNKKIKMSWTDRKIHDIHMKWTEEIGKIKCKDCSRDIIWKNLPELPHDVELLNSEMRIAEEGFKMHHCIFTNYSFPLIQKYDIAFHVRNFTLMFTIYSDYVEFDQAYYAYNKSLTEEDLEYAKSLKKYVEEIIKMNE